MFRGFQRSSEVFRGFSKLRDPLRGRFPSQMLSVLLPLLVLPLELSPISGTESASLNQEWSDSESCNSNRVIPRSLSALIGCDSDCDSESIVRDSILLAIPLSFVLLAAEFLAIPAPRFWESCDSRTLPTRHETQFLQCKTLGIGGGGGQGLVIAR